MADIAWLRLARCLLARLLEIFFRRAQTEA